MSSFGAIQNAAVTSAGRGKLSFSAAVTTVTAKGHGSVSADAKVNNKQTGAVRSKGWGAFSAAGVRSAGCYATLVGVGAVTTTTSSGGRAHTTLQTLTAAASNKPYGSARVSTEALAQYVASGSVPAVAPPVISYGIADTYILQLSGFGHMLTGGLGQVDGPLQLLTTAASNKPYGTSAAALLPLTTFAYTYWGNYADAVGSISPMQSTQTAAVIVAQLFTSNVSVTSTLMYGALYALSIASTISGTDTYVANGVYNVLLASLLGATNTVMLNGVSYDCTVVNATTGGISIYDNYLFNSFAVIAGNYYGAGAGGIYALQGVDDAGTAINSSITTLRSRLKSQQIKNVPHAYVGAQANGDIDLIVSTDGGITQQYTLTQRQADYATTRTHLARGVRSTYWQFELSSSSPLDVDYIDLAVVNLTRRI